MRIRPPHPRSGPSRATPGRHHAEGCSCYRRTRGGWRRRGSTMLGAFDPLDETIDVVEIEAGPKPEVPRDHPKSVSLAGLCGESAPQGLIDDPFERLPRPSRLLVETRHDVVLDRQCGSLAHIMKCTSWAS